MQSVGVQVFGGRIREKIDGIGTLLIEVTIANTVCPSKRVVRIRRIKVSFNVGSV